jgi:hypothetical protein
MIRRLERGDVNMHGFLLSVGGRLKAGAYYSPFREGQPHRMYSVSKTMTGLAIGMLADEGKLDLDRPVADYFPDLLPEHPDGRILRQTVRDMLRMATCYAQTAYREREDQDWTRPFFCGQPSHEPGTVFHYDTGASQVLAALIRRGECLYGPEEIRLHLDGLLEQAEQLRSRAPDFDLLRALEDPAFLRLTAPHSGVSPEDAWYALHRAEISEAAARKSLQALSRSLRSTSRQGRWAFPHTTARRRRDASSS